MTSYQFAPNPRKRTVGRFLTRVRRELQKAFAEEKASRGLTQAQIARELGVHRAVVCRQLAGTENIELRTLADYAWVFKRDIQFSMPQMEETRNVAPVPTENMPMVESYNPPPPIIGQQPSRPTIGTELTSGSILNRLVQQSGTAGIALPLSPDTPNSPMLPTPIVEQGQKLAA